ncbi:MAG: TonB-dependent receptor [Sphingomonadales bacterium]|nr:MAG: TonB-dependent receptor [Sphingomonadales bacterium]
MGMGTLYRTSAGMAAALVAATGAQAQTQSPVQPDTVEANDVAEIVVTASKREQKLRDVPSAITVLGGEALETQGVQSIRDYATLTPGLTLRDQGQSGIGTVIIRGLNTGAGSQSATSVVYLDDVPFTASSPRSGSQFVAPEPELADLDRIEVLKGPQGTLYGAASLGGVVRLISKRPDPSAFSGNARIEGTTVDGGGDGFSVRGSVNVPLVTDQLAVRATGFYRKIAGFTDNVGTGTKNVNDGTSKGGRIAIGWTPTDNLTIDLVGLFQNIEGDGFALQQNDRGTLNPTFGKRKYSMFFDAGSEVRYRVISGTATYELGAGRIIATGSYNETRTAFDRDTTGPFAALLPLLGYPAGTGLTLPTYIQLKKSTGEIRFVSNRLGPVEFVAGAYLTHERSTPQTHVNAVDIGTGAVLPGTLGNFFSSDTRDTYDEIAGFGNLTFYLSDRLDLTGGIRVAHNKERTVTVADGTLQTVFLGGSSVTETRFSDDVLTYLATLRWRPTDNLSAFVRAASGYRPGGAQTNPTPPPGAQATIRPDTVWNYEAGLKGIFLDNALTLEASAYHIDWKDVQLQGVFSGLVLLANGGKAKVDGFEIQATARPSDNFDFGFNLGYTDARIARIGAQASASTGAQNGDPLPLTPKWTASVIVDHRIPLSSKVEAELGGTLRFESHKYNSYPGDATDLNVKLPEITTVDLRAGVRFDNYRLQLRAENIFDRNGFVNSLTSGAGLPSYATLIRPRSFTVSLSADF